MIIVHKTTGSTFYFYGADKPEKPKSNKVDNIIAV
ncbi:phage terminase large subunit [Lactobacillus colini]|uniref:Phage terminase large subunit n=2 Tax=Lactobacillus colini TaxID=1819254 RepID=A0ABS4MBW6_9LACO|nr:phage terminase large subunit [Lactobacillus colini]